MPVRPGGPPPRRSPPAMAIPRAAGSTVSASTRVTGDDAWIDLTAGEVAGSVAVAPGRYAGLFGGVKQVPGGSAPPEQGSGRKTAPFSYPRVSPATFRR